METGGQDEILDELPQESEGMACQVCSEVQAMFVEAIPKPQSPTTEDETDSDAQRFSPEPLAPVRMPNEPARLPQVRAPETEVSEALACLDPSVSPSQAILDTGASKCVMGGG